MGRVGSGEGRLGARRPRAHRVLSWDATTLLKAFAEVAVLRLAVTAV